MVDLLIGKAYNVQSVTHEDTGSVAVISGTLRGVMLLSVDFNDQSCLITIKVCNKGIDGLLPLKSDGIVFQKPVPKLVFLWSGFFAEIFCIRNEFSFIRDWHGHSFHQPSAGPPPSRGRSENTL